MAYPYIESFCISEFYSCARRGDKTFTFRPLFFLKKIYPGSNQSEFFFMSNGKAKTNQKHTMYQTNSVMLGGVINQIAEIKLMKQCKQ